jgi:hypothetical protein
MARRRRPPIRRGFALIDVIVGGVMLGIGVAAVITVGSRALADQIEGEHQLVASWLADELLSMVVVEGPQEYPKIHDTFGAFEAPFALYEYEVDIQEQGPRQPFRVIAYVRWPNARGYGEVAVETLIAARLGEETVARMPIEILDRESRYYDDDQ